MYLRNTPTREGTTWELEAFPHGVGALDGIRFHDQPVAFEPGDADYDCLHAATGFSGSGEDIMRLGIVLLERALDFFSRCESGFDFRSVTGRVSEVVQGLEKRVAVCILQLWQPPCPRLDRIQLALRHQKSAKRREGVLVSEPD